MKYTNKIIEYGLYALVFLLPVQTRWIIRPASLEYSTLSLYGTDIILLLLIALFIIRTLKEPKAAACTTCLSSDGFKLSDVNIWWFIALLEMTAFISIFDAPDKTAAFFGWARLLAGIGLYWLMTHADYKKPKLLISFLAGAFLQGALAIWQFLAQATFASKWLGIASHSQSGLAGESVIETAAGRWLRAYGGSDHPNILGGLLAISIILLILEGLSCVAGKKFPISNFQFPSNFKFSNFLKLSASYFLLFALSAGLFFTFSRSAWLALGAGLAVIALSLLDKKVPVLKVQFLKIVIAVGLVFSTLTLIYVDLTHTRITADGRLENKSVSERLDYLGDAKDVIKANWLTGAGLNNYSLAVESLHPDRPAFKYQPVHNVFLLVWAETGILGLTSFIALLLYCLYASLKKLRDISDLRLMDAAIITALVVIMSLDHWLWSLHFGVLFFWLILGYASREDAL